MPPVPHPNHSTLPLVCLRPFYNSAAKGPLKCTQDFVLFRCEEAIDQGMLTTKNIVCYSQFWRQGVCHTTQDRIGKHQGQSKSRRSEGKAWPKAFIAVFTGRNGQGRASSWASLGLDSVNNFSGLSGWYRWSLVIQYLALSRGTVSQNSEAR